MIKPKQPNLLL